MKRILPFLLALCMLCAAGPAMAEDDPVLVTVNGEEIRESNLWLQAWRDTLMEYVTDMSEENLRATDQLALDYTVRYIAARQNLEKMGRGYTKEDLEAENEGAWSDTVEYFMFMEFGATEESTEEELAKAREEAAAYIRDELGYTDEYFMAITELTLTEDNALDLAGEGIGVTDAEVEAYYREQAEADRDDIETTAKEYLEESGEPWSEEEFNCAIAEVYEVYTWMYGYDLLYIPDGYRSVLCIVPEVDETLMGTLSELYLEQDGEDPELAEKITAAEKAVLGSAQGVLDEIYARLADGASFPDLVKEYSRDADLQDEETAASGIPVHAASIHLDRKYVDAAMALRNAGDVSEPVVGDDGVYVILYLGDIPGGPVEYTDELRDRLRADLVYERTGQEFERLMDLWASEAEIVWTEAGESWKLPEEADG